MASPITSITRQEVSALLRQVQGSQLLNRQLSSICQVNGLKSTGVKAELQRRIVDLIQETFDHNDVSRFHQVRQSIVNAFAQRSSPTKGASSRSNGSIAPSSLSTSLPQSMPPYNAGNYGVQRDLVPGASNGHRPYGSTAPGLSFKPSPFYRIEALISGVRTCEAMAQHRNSVIIPIKLSDYPILQRCLDDTSYKIMVFCASDNSGVQDIAFPHQSEIRVNGDEIKANLRGLKNKPGSTRPVDITSALRLKSNYMNNVDFIYALTNKAGGRHKFYLIINLCKTTSVSELVSMVSTRRKIPKESVVTELNKKAQDPDVVATSQVLSLKCPLSYMRLEVPCRSLSCTHMQCFDATSYLQLQEQGPQWICPICNKSAPFEQLAVDEYVRDILEKTPKSLEAVSIEPNGRWLIKSAQEETSSRPNGASVGDDDDDDDLFEVSEISVVGGRRLETPKNLAPCSSTPASGGRDISSGAAAGTSSNNSAKRSAPAVIDLTLSSDDEEPIQRPSKRQNTATNGYRGPSSLGFLSESPGDYPT